MVSINEDQRSIDADEWRAVNARQHAVVMMRAWHFRAKCCRRHAFFLHTNDHLVSTDTYIYEHLLKRGAKFYIKEYHLCWHYT